MKLEKYKVMCSVKTIYNHINNKLISSSLRIRRKGRSIKYTNEEYLSMKSARIIDSRDKLFPKFSSEFNH
jgi:hypothetical protein